MPPKAPADAPHVEIESEIDRTTWQKPKAVISKLGNLEGKTVADIGSGTGFFTFRLAFEAAKVLALDIDSDMIALVETFKTNLPYNYGEKIESRIVSPDNPGLVAGEVDHAVIINTVAYFADPVDYLTKVNRAIRANGKIMIVDFKEGYLPVTRLPSSERMTPAKVKEILELAGFTKIELDLSSLDFQYIAVGIK